MLICVLFFFQLGIFIDVKTFHTKFVKKIKVLRPQADQAGHEDPREVCRWSHKTGGVY